MVEALRAPGIGEHVSGIVTLSTPFVTSRRSGIRITGVVFSVLLATAWVLLMYFLFFSMVTWLWNQTEAYITFALLLWPARLLLLLLALRWSGQFTGILYQAIFDTAETVWDVITEWQDVLLQRFNHQLKQSIPMYCIRFRMDEALIALNFSRFLVKPLRFLTFIGSWLAAAGGLRVLILWPLGFLTEFVDLVFSTKLTVWLGVMYKGATGMFGFSIAPTILFFIIWTVTGYIMVALTLGHWGGIVSQLLLDFRITGAPDGATAITKVYSPLLWRRTLLHSLTYADRRALADVSQWMALRMCNDRGTLQQS